MAIFNNPSQARIEGNVRARFIGFEAKQIQSSVNPLIKIVFKIEGTDSKINMELGSSVDITKLNNFLSVARGKTVKSINEVDVPVVGGIIPADWDRIFVVETHYPMKSQKDATGKSVMVESRFAEVKSVISMETGVNPTAPNAIPSL